MGRKAERENRRRDQLREMKLSFRPRALPSPPSPATPSPARLFQPNLRPKDFDPSLSATPIPPPLSGCPSKPNRRLPPPELPPPNLLLLLPLPRPRKMIQKRHQDRQPPLTSSIHLKAKSCVCLLSLSLLSLAFSSTLIHRSSPLPSLPFLPSRLSLSLNRCTA